MLEGNTFHFYTTEMERDATIYFRKSLEQFIYFTSLFMTPLYIVRVQSIYFRRFFFKDAITAHLGQLVGW